ncbi:MAG: glycosyltransferase, partial [Armatimonadota bacterium]
MKVLHVHTDLVGGGIERMMGTLAMNTCADEVGICWCPANHPDPSAKAIHELEDAAVTLHRIPPPFLSVRYATRLARTVRRLRPDVLHLHGATVGVIGSIIGRTARVPAIVYTEHLQHDRHAQWLQRARSMTCGLPDRTVFVSQRSFRLAVEEGPMAGIADRSLVIRNGIDLSPFAGDVDADLRADVRDQLGIGSDTVAIGCVGLLWEAKGQEYL